MQLKKIVRFVHLWLGLSTGVLVFIISISGCLYVFKDEFSEAWYARVLFIDHPGKQPLPVSLLQQKAQRALGDRYTISAITTYGDPSRTWSFSTYASDPEALTYFGQVKDVRLAYLDPYTGKVAGIIDYKYDFFMLVKSLHTSLWLRGSIGRPVNSAATLVFVVMLVSGLALWWPGSTQETAVKQRFTIRWNASFKRVNYDLHSVPGFYALLISLVIALTGAAMTYGWLRSAAYSAANGFRERPKAAMASLPATRKIAADTHLTPMSRALVFTRKLYPGAFSIALYPAAPADSTLYVYANARHGTIYRFDLLTFNNFTGEPAQQLRHADKNPGEKLNAMNYDIHTGAIGGLAGKALAFIASLVAASLPVTGFLIWKGRR
ncbi:PepSY-associated TM helix domain-containing protein [Hufsiella ginkgonis]|uniref:PepSY domain-containing protein n=1 Tax=Hufsiella ginkgonis TaxID=2695274 RepID=A0A7K1XUH6_9SPHI|nr:PepSY-associated TM helix domain-containing protein [Hufsiella ginkgonis]MXV14610.1 PepSY domain-containing protein [Hufsiella ginkgonis]